jgi:hypothetical protein
VAIIKYKKMNTIENLAVGLKSYYGEYARFIVYIGNLIVSF